ncbi:hypothetical protein [Alloactinosynnema sp. L-07]|nr:hypothetical protein [Alloactinosynnema sp. L-07]
MGPQMFVHLSHLSAGGACQGAGDGRVGVGVFGDLSGTGGLALQGGYAGFEWFMCHGSDRTTSGPFTDERPPITLA